MEWILWMAVVAIIGLAAAAGSGRFGSMPDAVVDAPLVDLPDRDLDGDDLRRVQFATVVRGYSMAQVDALLDRLTRQLDGAPAQPPASFPDPVGEPARSAGDGEGAPPAWDHLR